MAAGKLQSWGTDVEALKSAVAHLNQMVNLINTVFPIVGINGVSVTQVYGRGTVIKGTPFPSIPYQPQLFPVLVQQNGGAAGSSTSTITATYNVYAVSDTGLTNPLNGGTSPTPLSPLMNRSLISPANVTVGVAASGSVGTACYNGSGAIQLLWVQETPSWGC